MLNWLKKHYSETAETNWYNCQHSDESMLRPCSKDVKKQIKLENQAKLQHVIYSLGFSEGQDYDGQKVLKNNKFVRKQMTFKETNQIIKKLNTQKSNSKVNDSQKNNTVKAKRKI